MPLVIEITYILLQVYIVIWGIYRLPNFCVICIQCNVSFIRYSAPEAYHWWTLNKTKIIVSRTEPWWTPEVEFFIYRKVITFDYLLVTSGKVVIKKFKQSPINIITVFELMKNYVMVNWVEGLSKVKVYNITGPVTIQGQG